MNLSINLPTVIVSLILAVIIYLDVRYLMKTGLDSCSGDCSGCGGSCKWTNDIEKARKKIAREKKIRAFLHLK